MLLTSSRRSRGTLMNSEATIGELPTKVPADDTPMASTRGILEAAVLKAVTISLKWYSGSSVILGNHTTSSEYTDSPSMTAEIAVGAACVEADAAAPSMWPPMALADSLAAGKVSSVQAMTSSCFS